MDKELLELLNLAKSKGATREQLIQIRDNYNLKKKGEPEVSDGTSEGTDTSLVSEKPVSSAPGVSLDSQDDRYNFLNREAPSYDFSNLKSAAKEKALKESQQAEATSYTETQALLGLLKSTSKEFSGQRAKAPVSIQGNAYIPGQVTDASGITDKNPTYPVQQIYNFGQGNANATSGAYQTPQAMAYNKKSIEEARDRIVEFNALRDGQLSQIPAGDTKNTAEVNSFWDNKIKKEREVINSVSSTIGVKMSLSGTDPKSENVTTEELIVNFLPQGSEELDVPLHDPETGELITDPKKYKEQHKGEKTDWEKAFIKTQLKNINNIVEKDMNRWAYSQGVEMTELELKDMKSVQKFASDLLDNKSLSNFSKSKLIRAELDRLQSKMRESAIDKQLMSEASAQNKDVSDIMYDKKKDFKENNVYTQYLPEDMKQLTDDVWNQTSQMRDFMEQYYDPSGRRGFTIINGELDMSAVPMKERDYIESRAKDYMKVYRNIMTLKYSDYEDGILEKRNLARDIDKKIDDLKKNLGMLPKGSVDRDKYQSMIDSSVKTRDGIRAEIAEKEKWRSSVFLTEPKNLTDGLSGEMNNSSSARAAFGSNPAGESPLRSFEKNFLKLKQTTDDMRLSGDFDASFLDRQGQRAREWVDLESLGLSLSSKEKEYLANRRILTALSPIFLNNNLGLTAKSAGFLESLRNGMSSFITPESSETSTETKIVGDQLKYLSSQGFQAENFNDEKILNKIEKRLDVPWNSMESAGEMTGVVSAVILDLAVSNVLIANPAISSASKIKKIAQLGKVYDTSMNATRVGRFLKPLISESVKAEIAGNVIGSSEEELNFKSFFIGGGVGKVMQKTLSKLPVNKLTAWAVGVFGGNGDKAINLMSKIGEANSRGLGEVAEEFTQELVQVYNLELGERGFWEEVENRFGTFNGNMKFVVSSYMMGAGFAFTGSKKAKDSYNKLSTEEKKIVDLLNSEVTRDVSLSSEKVVEEANKESVKENAVNNTTTNDQILEGIGEDVMKSVDVLGKYAKTKNSNILTEKDFDFLKNISGDKNMVDIITANIKAKMSTGQMSQKEGQELADNFTETVEEFSRIKELFRPKEGQDQSLTLTQSIQETASQAQELNDSGFYDQEGASITFERLSAIATDPILNQLYQADLQRQVNEGAITETQAILQNGEIQRISGISNQIPDMVQGDLRMNADKLIREQDKINESIKGKNPDLVIAEKTRLKEISKELQELSKANIVEEVTNASEVERLRQEEQTELLEAIQNAEEYLTDGKVDKEKITNPEDIAEFEKIYDKYDKVISPLLKPIQQTSEVEAKQAEIEKREKQLKSTQEKVDREYQEENWTEEEKELNLKVGDKVIEGDEITPDNEEDLRTDKSKKGITIVTESVKKGTSKTRQKVDLKTFDSQEAADQWVKEKADKIKDSHQQNLDKIDAKYDIKISALESPTQQSGGVEVKGGQVISADNSSNFSSMTEDGDGNFVFYHYSTDPRETIDPKKYGSNKANLTTKAEKQAIAKVGGVSMFYTSQETAEKGTGDYGHMVKIPKGKVYDMNNDYLNLKEQAKELHDKENPGMGYDDNSEAAYVTKIAEQNGFEMLVTEWKGLTRAQTVTEKVPTQRSETKGDQIKKSFDNDYESNKQKGYTPVIPEGKKTKLDRIYKKINAIKNKAKEYDSLYRLNENSAKLSEAEITPMIMDSNLDQSIKDEYQEAVKYKPEPRRSVKKENIVSVHNENGGSSISQSGENLFGKPGYSVSTHTDKTTKVKGKNITQEDIDTYTEKHKRTLKEDKVLFVGTWYDTKTDTTYIDVVSHEKDFKTAIDMGIAANQKSIFDLENGVEIDTGGTGEVTNESETETKTAKKGADLLERAFNETADSTEVMDQVENAKKAIAKVSPKTKIVVHKTAKDYKKSGKNRKQNEGGEYDVENDTIHINLERANKRTVAHEVFHALLLSKGMSNKKAEAITNKMLDVVKKTASPELLQTLEEFSSRYESTLQSEESIAELFGILASEYETLPRPTQNLIKRWLDKLAKLFGLNKFTDAEVIDLLNVVSAKVEAGQEITEQDVEILEVEEQGGSGQVGTFTFKDRKQKAPNIKDDTRNYAKNIIQKDLQDYRGQNFVTNMYDFTNAGPTNIGAGIVLDLYGGKNYVADMMEKTGTKLGEVSNVAAFNTKGQAEGFIKNAIDGNANLFAPHVGTKEGSWQFQQNIFEQLTEKLLDNNILTNQELIESFNDGLKSKNGQSALNIFNKKYKKNLTNLNEFKDNPKRLVELLDIDNNYSPDLRKILNDKIASNKKVQTALGVKNKIQFAELLEDPMNVGSQKFDIIGLVEFDNTTFKTPSRPKKGDADYHPSFAWTVKAKIKAIVQPTNFYQSTEVTDSYTKFNKSGAVVSTRENTKDFKSSNVSSSAGSGPKVATVKTEIKEDAPQSRKQKPEGTPSIADVRAKAKEMGVDEEGVVAYLKRLGYTDAEISTEANAGKDQAINDAKDKYELSVKKRGNNHRDGVSAALGDLKKSEWYKNSTDIQRDQAVVDIKKFFGEKIKKSPSVNKVLGVKKKKKVEVDEMAALKSQIRLEARAARESVKAYKDASKEIITYIKELNKTGVITSAQSSVMIKKVLSTNMLNEDMVVRLEEYISKVYAKAEIADKISRARKLRPTAKKNIKSKVGPSRDLIQALRDIIALDPSIVPLNKIDSYLDILSQFGERSAVLTLNESGLVMDSASDILNSIEQFEDVDVENLSLPNKLNEEIEADLNGYLKEIVSNNIEFENVQNGDAKKLAEFLNSITSSDLESLIKEKKDGSKDYSMLEKLKEIKSNMTNGYVPSLANSIRNTVKSKRAEAKIKSVIKKTKKYNVLVGFSKIYGYAKGVITGRTGLTESIRGSMTTSIDDVLGNLNDKTIYDNVIQPLAQAQSEYQSDMSKNVDAKLDAAEALLYKTKVPTIQRLNNDVQESRYKVQAYRLQREFESNPDSKQVAPAVDFIDATIKAIELDESGSRLNQRDIKIFKKIKKDFSEDGQISMSKIYDSLSKNEKKALKLIDEAADMEAKALWTATVIRGVGMKPINNYVHHKVITKDSAANSDKVLTDSGKMLNPSTKAGTIRERTPGAKAINFDPISSTSTGAKETLLDYHMTDAVRIVNAAVKGVKNTDGLTKFQQDVINAIDNVKNELLDSAFKKQFVSENSLGMGFKTAQKLGYAAALASVPRAGAELGSNLTYALSQPQAFLGGVKNFSGISMGSEGMNAMNNLGSSETTRLYDTNVMTSKMVDSNILYNSPPKARRTAHSVVDKASFIYQMGPKQVKMLATVVSDKLISTPDKAISRPFWFGAFALSFKRSTGISLTSKDMKNISNGTSKYLKEEYKVEREKAAKYADQEVIKMASSNNPFNTVPKNIVNPDDATYIKIYKAANSYMASFMINEYSTARNATLSLFKKGDLSKAQAIATLAGINVRMGSYMVLYSVLRSAFDGLFGFEDEEEEMSEVALRQAIGSPLSLIAGRGLGQIPRGVVNFGLEQINENYLEGLRDGKEYDPYKHSISFSQISEDDLKSKSPEENLMKLFAGPYSPLLSSTSRGGKVLARSITSKKYSTKEKYKKELSERMTIEAAGNLGFLPFYKDIRRMYLKEQFKNYKK